MRARSRQAPARAGGRRALEVDVSRSTDRAFRRAGGFGVSPILQVDDFRKVPAARRDPFERLARWIDANPSRIAFGGGALPDAVRVPLEHLRVRPKAPWLLAAALALAALAAFAPRARGANVARADKIAAVALFAVALLLRLALGTWGPLHVNGQGALWVMAAAVDPVELSHYGPGYPEVFSLVAQRSPFGPDVAIFATNAVISALLPILLFALARLLGVDRRRAGLAALVLVLDPVSIRIAATESYFSAITALIAAASVAAAATAYHAARREPRRAACWALAAGLLCAQAARFHPAAWVPVALAPLAAAGAPSTSTPDGARSRRPLRARVTLMIGVLALSGATVLITSVAELLHSYESMLGGDTIHGIWIRPSAGLPLALAALVAFVFLARPRMPFALGVLVALVLVAIRTTYGQSPLWQAGFDRFFAVPLLIGAAALVPASLARSRAFVPAGAALVAALFAWRAPAIVEARTTDHEEYLWARRWLRDLPPSCNLVYVSVAERRVLFLPTYVTTPPLTSESARRLDGREPIHVRDVLGEPRCTFYVHTSLCESAQGRPVCADVERQLTLEPVARASFAAAPSSPYLPYDRDRVESVISRVVGVEEDR